MSCELGDRRRFLRLCGQAGLGLAGSCLGLDSFFGAQAGGGSWLWPDSRLLAQEGEGNSVAGANADGPATVEPDDPLDGSGLDGSGLDVPGLDYVEIRFGMSAPFSGPHAGSGLEYLRGALTWLNQVNTSSGIHGRRITLLAQDDGGQPRRALRNTVDLLNGGVFGLFAYAGSNSLLRTLPALDGHPELVLLAPRSGASAPRQPPWTRQTFFLGPSNRAVTRALLSPSVNGGLKRLGLHLPLDASGRDLAQAARQTLRELGSGGPGAVIETVHRPAGATIRSLEKARDHLLRGQIDALLLSGDAVTCSRLLSLLRGAGWQGTALLDPGTDGDRILDLLTAEGSPVAPGPLLHARPVPVFDPETRLPPRSSIPAAAAMAESATLAEATTDLRADLGSEPAPEDPTSAVSDYLKIFRRQPPRLPTALLTDDHVDRGANTIGLEGFIAARVLVEAVERSGPNPDRGAFRRALESMTDFDPGLGHGLGFTPGQHLGPNRVFLAQAEGNRFVPTSGRPT